MVSKLQVFSDYVNSIYPPPLVLLSLQQSSPWGSTSLATLRASEFAKSVLAGVTARIRQLSLVMNCKIMSRIWCSMSTGWSPTATLVIPGKSMRVRFNTVEGREREEWHFNNGCRDYERGLRKAVVLRVFCCITVWRVHSEVDGNRRDALIGSCNPVGFCFNFLTDFFKVHKLPPFAVQELGIFYKTERWRVWLRVIGRWADDISASRQTRHENHIVVFSTKA